MSRNYSNWIKGYLDYAAYSEAPRHCHFWVAVSAIAGALRRQVWIDMAYFKWFPNFYVILVAPPGIVSKSTTAGIGMSILKQVPGIKFGPDVVTWQALVTSFAESAEAFEYEGAYHPMCAMTLESSEFGNLLDPTDKAMVDLLVSLWDGKQGVFSKKTKSSGNDEIINPWINLIACTTPSWIAGNFPEYMIGGGFTSRTVFVYADQKAKLVAYPGRHVPSDHVEKEKNLIHDLTEISKICGEYRLTKDAETWGTNWYEQHYATRNPDLDDDRFGGYFARKQTHIHKLAMILAAAESNDLVITAEHLSLADTMVTDLEPSMKEVFGKIGKTEDAQFVDRLIYYIRVRDGCKWQEAYAHVHQHFPKISDFEAIITGAVRAGFLKLVQKGADMWVLPGERADEISAKDVK